MIDLVFMALLGACLGSFLTVLSPRLQSGETGIWTGRSRAADGRTLRWFELVPIISWLALRGRDGTTGQRISAFYPLTELISALAFALVAWQFGMGAETLPYYIITFGLLAVGVHDARYGLVDRRISIPVFVFALAWGLTQSPWWAHAASALAVGGVFAAQHFGSRGRWCGEGDIDLGLIAGACATLNQSWLLLFCAYLLGTLWISLTYILHRALPTTLPMGPYLAVAGFLFLLWGEALSIAYWNWVLP